MENIRINYKKLRQTRKSKDLSILEVSEKTGIPAATLQKYESGIIKKVPLDLLKKICKLYKKIINYILGGQKSLLFRKLFFIFLVIQIFLLKKMNFLKCLK